MRKYTAWLYSLVDRTMMAGLYKAEKLLKAIDDEEATSTEIEALAHALQVVHISDTLMDHIEHDHANELAHTETVAPKVDTTKAALVR